jgi:broad specificity phosphatase PhoE
VLAAIYTDELRRQQQTAQLFAELLREHSQTVPDVVVDEQWNELSLAAVYRGLAARLCAEERTFAADYAAMQDTLRTEPHATAAAVGRCDRVVIQAWMENRYADYEGDSWMAFRQRVECSLSALHTRSHQHIAVFTSATPDCYLDRNGVGIDQREDTQPDGGALQFWPYCLQTSRR